MTIETLFKGTYRERVEHRDAEGRLHRDDGPAVEYADGDCEWWLNNKWLTKAEFLAKTQRRTVRESPRF